MLEPDTVTLNRITPGAEFVIAADTAGHFNIFPGPKEPAQVEAGLIRHELLFHCLDVIKQLADPSRSIRRLERMRHIKDLDVLLRLNVGEPVVTVTVDLQQRIYLP